MREILFRGKRVDNGEWVEGLLWKKKHNTDKIFISCFPDEDDNEEVFVIYPSTIGQYTGLTDKNGTKIFEGDFVKHPIGTFIVKFLNGTFLSSLTETNYLSFLCSIHNQSEVIANIHDNPELLGGDL